MPIETEEFERGDLFTIRGINILCKVMEPEQNGEMVAEVYRQDRTCTETINPVDIVYRVKLVDSMPNYEGEFIYLRYIRRWVEITHLVHLTSEQVAKQC
jgi:hypothetical protein